MWSWIILKWKWLLLVLASAAILIFIFSYISKNSEIAELRAGLIISEAKLAVADQEKVRAVLDARIATATTNRESIKKEIAEVDDRLIHLRKEAEALSAGVYDGGMSVDEIIDMARRLGYHE